MRILPTIALSAAIASVGCTTTGTNANTSQNARQNSSDWEQSIKSKLASDPKTARRKIDVSADAGKNQVTLSGTVYSKTERREAINDAKAARPGVEVVDKIEVKPREIPTRAYTGKMANQEHEMAKANGDKPGNSSEDARIHTKIDSKLIADTTVTPRKINIDVVNGVVTLRGTVDSPEAKAKASRMAMHTFGVKKVNNLLRVRAGERRISEDLQED
jgi:hyperosmotically inducible periplasmic protein